MDQAAFSYSIKPLSPHTGAEIRGLDLRRPVDAATRAGFNRAFEDHAVLVIRDQRLSAPEFLQAMQIFGEIFPQHNSRFQVPECPAIHYISNQDKLEDGRVYIPGEGYHTDHSNDAEPPKATALHAVKLPKTGGDTQFVNMYEAYAALPETTKKKIDALQARHVYQSKHSARKLPQLPGERKAIAAKSVVCIRWCAAIRQAAARRSTSIRSVSRKSSAWTTRKRCRCSTRCWRTPRSPGLNTGTNGSPATW